MRRREFIGLVGGAAASVAFWPLAAHAQKPRRIAFVHSGIPADRLTESAGPFWVRRFFETLRGLGNIEGSNLIVERFSAEGRADRFEAIAADVVGAKPDVIVANLNGLVHALMTATSVIPIVGLTADPVAAGLVTNLARPGGNLTGVSIKAGIEIQSKRLEILKQAIPSATRIGHLLSGTMDDGTAKSMDEAGQRLGVAVIGIPFTVVSDAQLQRAFAEMAQQKLDAAVVGDGGSLFAQRATIVALAEKYRLPTIYPYRDYVEQGGLMAFAPELGELAERMATDVHQILNGARPGDIPFYLPSKFQLMINLKTAGAIGREIPATLVARADEVIE
jgi:putative tryptophan/tyrosine transport system substrate-binding protein